jgi:hypothetical protein
MAKLDPKILKKIKGSSLIQAAKELGIKNVEKVSKENLVPAFIKAVEALSDADQNALDDAVVNTYNEIIKLLEPETAAGADTDVKPAKAEKKAKGQKGEKAPKEKKVKEKKERSSNSKFNAVLNALKSKKSGKLEDLYPIVDKKYSEGGKTPQTGKLRFFANGILMVLSELGFAEMSEGSYKIK